METSIRSHSTCQEKIFQYPLVDWGDGDLSMRKQRKQTTVFQYPLVDWGDGDLVRTELNLKMLISVSSGGLG